jgi:hypothetical protein
MVREIRKKSLVFDSAYLASDVIDTALKMYYQGHDISLLESAFALYRMVCFFDKIAELSRLNAVDGKIDKIIKDDLVSRQSILTRDSSSLNLKGQFLYLKIFQTASIPLQCS